MCLRLNHGMSLFNLLYCIFSFRFQISHFTNTKLLSAHFFNDASRYWIQEREKVGLTRPDFNTHFLSFYWMSPVLFSAVRSFVVYVVRKSSRVTPQHAGARFCSNEWSLDALLSPKANTSINPPAPSLERNDHLTAIFYFRASVSILVIVLFYTEQKTHFLFRNYTRKKESGEIVNSRPANFVSLLKLLRYSIPDQLFHFLQPKSPSYDGWQLQKVRQSREFEAPKL